MTYKKEEFVTGILWSALDKFGIVVVQIILEIVMARLLLPSDYGVMGIIAVFLAIGQVFTDGGFSNALIQKQDRSESDFSTVFFCNLIVSVVIYGLLFIGAPYISQFYDLPVLTAIIRIIGLTIIINSLVIVHKTKLSISLNFKIQAKYSLLSVLLSGAVGLFLALNGYGVWSLVYQTLLLYVLNAVFIIYNLRWVPLFVFSKKSFDTLFYFGSKVLMASLVQAVYNNLYSVLIAKKFSTKELGLYSKANQFTLFPISTLTTVMQRVAFPYLSSYQGDNDKLFTLNQKFTKLNLILIMPLFFGISALSEPIVKIVFSDAWIDLIPLMRILSIAFVFYPVIVNNMFLFQIKNKTQIYLRIEIITKITGILILFGTLQYGIIIMSLGLVVQQFLQLVITSMYCNRLLEKQLFSQLKMVGPHLLVSFLIFFVTLYGISFVDNRFSQFVIGGLLIGILYFVYYYFFMKNEIVALYVSLKN
jgi:O-antigen/teichoic acid export membrane protein